MCRCPAGRKYFMIWSTKDELQSTLERVRARCESLRQEEGTSAATYGQTRSTRFCVDGRNAEDRSGVERDLELHKNDSISTEAITPESFRAKLKAPKVRCRRASRQYARLALYRWYLMIVLPLLTHRLCRRWTRTNQMPLHNPLRKLVLPLLPQRPQILERTVRLKLLALFVLLLQLGR